MFVQNVQAYVKQMLRNKEYFRTVFNLFFFELIYLSIKNQWVSFFLTTTLIHRIKAWRLKSVNDANKESGWDNNHSASKHNNPLHKMFSRKSRSFQGEGGENVRLDWKGEFTSAKMILLLLFIPSMFQWLRFEWHFCRMKNY
jgi:hypothetical protein